MKHFWLIAAFAALNVADAFADIHRYEIPQRGAIVLDVPAGWREEVRFNAEAKRPLIVKLSPATGSDFRVNVTPMWNPDPLAATLSAREIHAGVGTEAESAKRQAVERDLKVVDFTAGKSYGSYFSATARNATAGGFRHLTQGAMVLEDLVVHFDVYSNEAREDVVARTIEMVKAARREK